MGSGSQAADCSITSYNLYMKENTERSPAIGVFFGTYTTPGKPTAFLYLVMFKHARKFLFGDVGNCRNTTSEGHAEIVDGISVDGVTARLSGRFDIDSKSGRFTGEQYTFNERNIEITRGRLFLVDLTANPAKWKQLDVELPANLPNEMDRETVRRVAEEDAPALRRKFQAVDDFLK